MHKLTYRDMQGYLITEKRDDGSYYTKLKKGKHHDYFQDLVRECHDGMMPDDFKYSTIQNIIDRWCEQDEVIDYDRAMDLVYEMDPDIYTSDLLDWVSSNLNRVYYCDKAMTELCSKDFVAMLQYAQKLEVQEIGSKLAYHFFMPKKSFLEGM